MQDFICLQFQKDGVLSAVVMGGLGRWPHDSQFENGSYQRVFMERGEGTGFIKAGGCLPDHFTLLSFAKFSLLKNCPHHEIQQLLTQI